MFSLFKSAPFADSVLGKLERSDSYWRGALSLPGYGAFRLLLTGDRRASDANALVLAKDLPGRFASLAPDIQSQLFEHYEPYRDAGGMTGDLPQIHEPEAVWPHVSPPHILISPRRGITTIQIAIDVAWDEEHLLAALVQEWRVVELCGSVPRI